jgi:hypothetical protein
MTYSGKFYAITDEEIEASIREADAHAAVLAEYPRERVLRYLQVGVAIDKITRELLEDDQRWEEARKTPIDPNNFADMFIRYLTHGPE